MALVRLGAMIRRILAVAAVVTAVASIAFARSNSRPTATCLLAVAPAAESTATTSLKLLSMLLPVPMLCSDGPTAAAVAGLNQSELPYWQPFAVEIPP